MLLRDAITDLYAPVCGVSDRTIRLYRMTVSAWSKLLGREPTTDDLDEVTVSRFVSSRLRERAAATAAKDRAQIHAVWMWLWKRGVVKSAPTIRRVVVPERIPEAWMEDELRRLIAAAGQEPGFVSGIPAGLFWRALLLTTFCTAERIGSVLQLRWSDVDGRLIVFRAETRKHGRRDLARIVPQDCADALSAIRSADPRVFPWDRTHTVVWHRLGSIVKRAGLPGGRRSKFHRLRKSALSFHCAAGGDPQRLADHSSPAVTKRYLDPRIVGFGDASALLPTVS